MNNRIEFQKFIGENSVLKDNGENYKDKTKKRRLNLILEFIKESGKKLYEINEPKEIRKLLKSEKKFIC